ncbi:MAG: hypothetical protein LUO93_00435 [Methanomicrobiales archaeon]|nr:hypothetical protein [Methanomicrobiales archaeon]
MSRSGTNHHGSGGRNYRLNWDFARLGRATFGEWTVFSIVWGGEERWCVSRKGHQVRRRYGNYEGYLRLKTMDAAMRWVERKLRLR